MRHTLLIALAACLLLPAGASAQDTPRFGIVMGFPAAVGILWNVSDRVALRPMIDWSRSSSESTTTISGLPPGIPTITTTTTTNISGWNLGAGVSALFYLTKADALRTYVSPGFSYARGSSTIDTTVTGSRGLPTPLPTGPVTTRSSNYTTFGAFGAQYTLGQRFGIFGELGLSYVHS